jgi:acyl carrier protein
MKKLNAALSKILDVDKEKITDDMSPDNVENWDSFNGLMLVSELEETFNVKFTIEEVVAVKCVSDIKEALLRHGVVLENN